MKNKKQLKKLVQKMIEESIKGGILQEKKVSIFVRGIKKLPIPKAIFMLNGYMKGLRMEISKHTLIVESAVALSSEQLYGIKSELKNLGKIVKTETKINPDLIGGIKIRLADMIFDDSVKARIGQLGGMIRG